MGALDKIKQIDEQQQTMEMLETLTSTVHAVEQQLVKVTKTVADLTGFVKVMDEQQDLRLTRLTSQRSAPGSTPPDDGTKKTLSEIVKTLASVEQTLTTSKNVTLPGGESVKQSDLSAYTMMRRLSTALEKATTASADLADAVTKRGRIVIDPDRLAEHAVRVLDARLANTVDARIGDLESRVAVLGAAQAAEASRQAEEVVGRADEVVRAVNAAEHRVDALATRVTWTTAGRLALTLVPLTAVLLVVGGLTMGAAHALGFGPLLGWAWSSFMAAQEWWAKGLIAVGTLGGVAAFGGLVWWLAKKIKDEFGRW